MSSILTALNVTVSTLSAEYSIVTLFPKLNRHSLLNRGSIEIYIEVKGQCFGLKIDASPLQRGCVIQDKRRRRGFEEIVEILLGLGKPGNPLVLPFLISLILSKLSPGVLTYIAAGNSARYIGNTGGHYRCPGCRFQ